MAHQALTRGRRARHQYTTVRAAIVRVQAVLRMFVKRVAFLGTTSAARRVQQCVRSWRRNQALYRDITGVFAAARRGDVREVTRIIVSTPQLLYVRDRYCGGKPHTESASADDIFSSAESGDAEKRSSPRYSTLVHAACEVRVPMHLFYRSSGIPSTSLHIANVVAH